MITAKEAKIIADNNNESLEQLKKYRQQIDLQINNAAKEGKYNIEFSIFENNYNLAVRLAEELADIGFNVSYIPTRLFITW